jgi:hypothetical protein
LYTNEACEVAAVPFWFRVISRITIVIRVIYLRLLSLMTALLFFRNLAFHFGRSKSAMLSIISSDASPRSTHELIFGSRKLDSIFALDESSVKK